MNTSSDFMRNQEFLQERREIIEEKKCSSLNYADQQDVQ